MNAMQIFSSILSILLIIITPIIGLFFVKNRSFKAFFTGCVTFIISSLLIEGNINLFVFQLWGDKITKNIWIYAIYGGLLAGLFEETGRLISFKYFLKGDNNLECALSYGLGHGGSEAFLVVITLISNIILCSLYKSGFELNSSLIVQSKAIINTPWYFFILSGLERILAICLHLINSTYVFLTIKTKKYKYYIFAIIIHLFVNATSTILNSYFSIFIVELILFFMIFLISTLTIMFIKIIKGQFNSYN